MISHIESKKEFFKRIYMNLFAEQKQTHKLRKQIFGYQRGQMRGRNGEKDGLGVWDRHMHTGVCGMIGQWGPAVEHSELYPIFCYNLCGKESEREWMHVHV